MNKAESLDRGELAREEAALVERTREAMGDTAITDFARRLGLNHESVRRYIRGLTSPPAVYLLRMAHRCDVDCHWLLTGQREHAQRWLRTVDTKVLTAELSRRADALIRDLAPSERFGGKATDSATLICAAMDRARQVMHATGGGGGAGLGAPGRGAGSAVSTQANPPQALGKAGGG